MNSNLFTGKSVEQKEIIQKIDPNKTRKNDDEYLAERHIKHAKYYIFSITENC